jgi:hypothetical protein
MIGVRHPWCGDAGSPKRAPIVVDFQHPGLIAIIIIVGGDEFLC